MISERSLKREEEYCGDEMETMTIIDRHDETTRKLWSADGRYSLSESYLTKDGIFFVDVRLETQEEWMEPALEGDDPPRPAATASITRLKDPKFGVVFKANDGLGNVIDHWPRVVRIDKKVEGKDSLAAEYPAIRVGCKLQRINDQPAPASFELAKRNLMRRPLKLEFSAAVSESTDTVERWLRAGLAEIGLVRRHEMRHTDEKLQQFRSMQLQRGTPAWHSSVRPPEQGCERACCGGALPILDTQHDKIQTASFESQSSQQEVEKSLSNWQRLRSSLSHGERLSASNTLYEVASAEMQETAIDLLASAQERDRLQAALRVKDQELAELRAKLERYAGQVGGVATAQSEHEPATVPEGVPDKS